MRFSSLKPVALLLALAAATPALAQYEFSKGYPTPAYSCGQVPSLWRR